MAGIKYDLTGCLFGDFYVLNRIKSTKKHARYKCRCLKTGLTATVDQCDLLSGRRREIGLKHRHGMAHTTEYKIWEGIKQRCTNPKNKAYKNYGKRGIGISNRWEQFIYFFYDMGPRPSKNHSIERVDNDKGYYPENCKWATKLEQERNTRRNVKVSFDGEIMVLKDVELITGIPHKKLSYHLKKGRDIDDIVKFISTNPKGTRWKE